MRQREFYPVPKFRQFKIYSTFKKYPWYSRSPILRYLVAWIIYFSTFSDWIANRWCLKIGDKVKYNWMAKIQLSSHIKKYAGTKIVKEILCSDGSGIKFTDGDGCDPFWVRKIYFWEK